MPKFCNGTLTSWHASTENEKDLFMNVNHQVMTVCLDEYVEAAHTDHATFRFYNLKRDTIAALAYMDSFLNSAVLQLDLLLVDLDAQNASADETSYWKERRRSLASRRPVELRIGHIEECLSAMGYAVGSPEASEFMDQVDNTLVKSAYHDSLKVAKRLGAAAAFNAGVERKAAHMLRVKEVDRKFYAEVMKYGLRNALVFSVEPATPDCSDALRLFTLQIQARLNSWSMPSAVHEMQPMVVERRPEVLDCDVVRFQNNRDKWVALVGLLDGRPYEIFTGLQDEDEGIVLPKSVFHGHIVKVVLPDGSKRYDFQFRNKRGYRMTVEELNKRFNKEYWNYAKLISGVLRYRMPLEYVIKLVNSLQLGNENINTWKVGVCRALKKYVNDDSEQTCPKCGEPLIETANGLLCESCGYTAKAK